MRKIKSNEKITKKIELLNEEIQENIDKYLKGISFPIEKKHILEQAKKNNAPQIFLKNLNKLKDQKYHNQSDIVKVGWNNI